MSTPQPADTTDEQRKLRLEIDLLEREKKWYWTIGRLPVLGMFIAAAGIVVSIYQVQKTERAQIEERTIRAQDEKQERISRIQGQVRVDKEQLAQFEIDPKVSSLEADFLIDDLRSLIGQLPDREQEETAIAEQLRRITWHLANDESKQRKDFDFDVSALRRWGVYREYWHSLPDSHHGFLDRMYYSEITQLRPCFEKLRYQAGSIDYQTLPKSCDKELIGALIYGFGEHLKVAKDTADFVLVIEINSFKQASGNVSLGDELLTQARLQH